MSPPARQLDRSGPSRTGSDPLSPARWSELDGCAQGRHAPRLPQRIEALVCDRDGTLVEDVPYNDDPRQVRPMPGVRPALARARAAGLRIGIVTNQSGVARGHISAAGLLAVQARVDALLGPFHAVVLCPHGPQDGCTCRKPTPGLVVTAAALLGVRPDRCVVIGDSIGDVDAALGAGAVPILIEPPGGDADDAGHVHRTWTFAAAVDAVLGSRRPSTRVPRPSSGAPS
jgi:histidinol-phosphate phosphatase family protein